MTEEQPVAAIPSATLVLMRDGAEGLELLMVSRHRASGFAAGATVFPGGKIDRADAELGRRSAPASQSDDRLLASRVAAIRESFEEGGILLARARPSAPLLSAGDVANLCATGGSEGFAELVTRAGLELATDLLVPFAHWITPVNRPKRFDTLFYLAPAPGDQSARHDGREAVEAMWTTPRAAIAAADAGRISLVFATRLNLMKLGQHATTAAALEAARREPIVTVQPEFVRTPEGPAFRIPEAAGYGAGVVPADGIPRA